MKMEKNYREHQNFCSGKNGADDVTFLTCFFRSMQTKTKTNSVQKFENSKAGIRD